MSYYERGYGGSSSSSGVWFLGGIAILAVVIGIVFFSCTAVSNWIDNDEALVRFKELAGTSEVQIVRHSNSNPILGDPYDVTYELVVKGKPTSGRCTAGELSRMICRLYTSGGD